MRFVVGVARLPRAWAEVTELAQDTESRYHQLVPLLMLVNRITDLF